MALALDAVYPQRWMEDATILGLEEDPDLLAGIVYFLSAFMTTQQLSIALGFLENSPEVWYLPTIWSFKAIPTSTTRFHPPFKGVPLLTTGHVAHPAPLVQPEPGALPLQWYAYGMLQPREPAVVV